MKYTYKRRKAEHPQRHTKCHRYTTANNESNHLELLAQDQLAFVSLEFLSHGAERIEGIGL